jgi:hypothetical protein
MDAADALGNWFRAKRRRAYIGRGITVYYPERQRFAPDLFVVLDAEPGPRRTWVVNREGRTRTLFVATPERVPNMPDVPTAEEVGLRDYKAYSWYGLFGPAGTPRPVVERLGRELAAVLAMPAVQERLRSLGVEPDGRGPDAFAAFQRDEITKWGRVIRDAGIEPE